jgi:hypothetical protein
VRPVIVRLVAGDHTGAEDCRFPRSAEIRSKNQAINGTDEKIRVKTTRCKILVVSDIFGH